jgi:hypothetical protein
MAANDLLKNYADVITRYLAEQTKMMVFILDRTGCIVWANAAFRNMHGKHQQIEGLDIRGLLAPESRALFAESEGRITDNMHLLFSNAANSSHMLTCRVLFLGEYELVLSEHIMATETAVMQKMTVMNNELNNLTRELHRKNVALEQAMSEIKVLKTLLPICMHCRKIRDEEGYWSQIEAYIMKHSDTEFSHGICEECLNKFYPEQVKHMREEEKRRGMEGNAIL